MKASIVDLRYHMNDVIKALDKNEAVEALYHNKKIGVIYPVKNQSSTKIKVKDHPFYGMGANEERSVEEAMQKLRGGRHDDI